MRTGVCSARTEARAPGRSRQKHSRQACTRPAGLRTLWRGQPEVNYPDGQDDRQGSEDGRKHQGLQVGCQDQASFGKLPKAKANGKWNWRTLGHPPGKAQGPGDSQREVA